VPDTLPRALLFLLGLWLALQLLGPLAPPARGEPAPEPALAALAEELHRAVNRVREGHHLVALTREPALDRAARAHSADMAARGYLAHESPEGTDPVDRIRAAGASGFTLAAENAGRTGRPDAVREIVHGWLHSPVHRRNLLLPAFNAGGVGVARAPDGTLYVTQVYVARPRE